MGALLFFVTASFGTYALYWFGLTLCNNGSLGLFLTSSFGTDAVYWLGLTLCINGSLVFVEHPLLALMLCTGWV